MDKKRLVLLLIFTSVCIVVGFLLYVVFFKKPTTIPPITEPGSTRSSTSTRGELPTSGGRTTPPPSSSGTNLPRTDGTRAIPGVGPSALARVLPIIENGIVGPKVSSDGTVAFYNKQDGRFYKVNANGELELMSDEIFYNVQKVTWSPQESKSIIEYPDGSNIVYDFTTKKQISLPKQWEEFSFENGGKSIAAKNMALSPENRWIVTSDTIGNNIRRVAPMGENANKVSIDWSPNKQIIATSRTGESLGGDRQEVLFVGLNGENFKSMVVEGRGFTSNWSPQGDKMVYSVYSARSEFKPELWIVNANPDTIGDDRKLLNVNTWPEKCSFSDDRFLYCGVPQKLQTGAGIAPAVADSVPDVIYRIDTQTGIKTEVPLDTPGHVVEKMFVGEDGKTLFFTDKRRPGLFKIPL